MALVMLALPVVAGADGVVAATVPTSARQTELIKLLRQDCGSCHGMTLRGGLGPALLPEALHGKPEPGLVATILHGRPGTPMPPWQAFMTEAEAAWLVENLVRGIDGH